MSSPKNSIEKGRHEGRKEGREEGIKISEEMGIQIGQERGRHEGREEGIKIGEEMGKIEGKAEGRRERDIEVAKNLLKAGVSADIISQTTGLSYDEITQLKEEIA